MIWTFGPVVTWGDLQSPSSNIYSLGPTPPFRNICLWLGCLRCCCVCKWWVFGLCETFKHLQEYQVTTTTHIHTYFSSYGFSGTTSPRFPNLDFNPQKMRFPSLKNIWITLVFGGLVGQNKHNEVLLVHIRHIYIYIQGKGRYIGFQVI